MPLAIVPHGRPLVVAQQLVGLRVFSKRVSSALLQSHVAAAPVEVVVDIGGDDRSSAVRENSWLLEGGLFEFTITLSLVLYF